MEFATTTLRIKLDEILPLEHAERVVRARGLERRFGAYKAVDGFDLDVYRGEVFGVLGPNGAGKSTTMRMLLGLLAPTAGTIDVLGCELPRQAEELRPRIGYMTQRFSLYEDLSIRENLEFVAEIFGLDRKTRRRRVDEVIEDFGLIERRKQRPATLSGGWKQRLALAAATVHEPELLLLDEPTAGVDPASRRLFWEKIFQLTERGATILVSTHYMDEAVRCHRLCLMRRGRRAAVGVPAELEAALEGRVLEIDAPATARAIAVLQSSKGVLSVTQMGHRVHVLLEEADAEAAAPDLLWDLSEAGITEAEVKIADPTLEDVFVAVTRSGGVETAGESEARTGS